MKAIVCEKYGSTRYLQIKEIPTPLVKKNDVLIKIKASTVASGDCVVRNASPFVRLAFGWKRPRQPILGTDVAGVVERVGSNVDQFEVGDRVIASTGMKFGGHAEYVAVHEDSAIIKYSNSLSFEEATSIAFGGNAGLYFLRKASIKPGSKVLIYGASGAVGSSSIQLAKHFGAEVTGICSGRNSELIYSLGADLVVNYEEADFATKIGVYDVIFDAVGKTSKKNWQTNLTSKGKFLTVARGLVKENPADLRLLINLIEHKQLEPVVDKIYPMEQIREAYHYVETGKKRGSVVIQINKESE